jgi:hypothetical protein
VFLIKCALELAVIVNHSQWACQILVIVAPVDYSILLLILSLAALDRYLAIVRYEWYKKSVTNRGVIILISVASIVSFIVITIPFWTGYQSIYSCTNNLTHMNWILMWDLFLGVAGVVLHFMIFIASKTLIKHYLPNYRQQPPVTVRFVNSTARQSNVNSISGIIPADLLIIEWVSFQFRYQNGIFFLSTDWYRINYSVLIRGSFHQIFSSFMPSHCFGY